MLMSRKLKKAIGIVRQKVYHCKGIVKPSNFLIDINMLSLGFFY